MSLLGDRLENEWIQCVVSWLDCDSLQTFHSLRAIERDSLIVEHSQDFTLTQIQRQHGPLASEVQCTTYKAINSLGLNSRSGRILPESSIDKLSPRPLI